MTCANDGVIFGEASEKCDEVCLCDSSNGYIRDDLTGECIKTAECFTCDANEIEGQVCGDTPPEQTCASLGQVFLADIGQRRQQINRASVGCSKACFCDSANGYVRQDENGPCIRMR